MIEAWKLRRELRRIWRQATSPWRALRDHIVMPLHHEHVLRRQVRVTQGGLPGTGRVAIYLLYPTLGLQPSHLRALRYLAGHGCAPLVVSNLPIVGPAREELLAHAWQLMERPNFGHDFGGYREAVLWLAPRLAELDRLFILNDSTWFPLPGARDWMADVEALGMDYAGASAQNGVPTYLPEMVHQVEWRYDHTRANFHYGSFALALRRPVLADPEFIGFWQRYRPKSLKAWTINEGEIALTQWAIRRGHSHGATLDVGRLHQELLAMDERQLHRMVRELATFNSPALTRMRSEILGGVIPGREMAEKFILANVSLYGVPYTLARYAWQRHGYAFLKKAPLWMDAEAAVQTLELCAELPGEFGQEILAEAQALHRMRLPDAA